MSIPDRRELAEITDVRFLPALDLLGRTGLSGFVLRYDEDDEGGPLVWLAVGRWDTEAGTLYEVGSGFNPTQAVFRLCDEAISGGRCHHCNRMAGFAEDIDLVAPALLADYVCWQQWDPELATFRRSCE